MKVMSRYGSGQQSYMTSFLVAGTPKTSELGKSQKASSLWVFREVEGMTGNTNNPTFILI